MKKVKVDPLEIQVIEHTYKFQRPIMSKNRVIRSREQTISHSALLDILMVNQPVPTSTPAVTSTDKKMRINWILEKKKNPIIIVPELLYPGNLCLGNI